MNTTPDNTQSSEEPLVQVGDALLPVGPRLHRDIDGGQKYLVLDREGRVSTEEYFVLKARDPYAQAALEAYVMAVIEAGGSGTYAESVDNMRVRWAERLALAGPGNPEEGPKDPNIHKPRQSVLNAMKDPGGTYEVSKRA